jgi:hypothetical protein
VASEISSNVKLALEWVGYWSRAKAVSFEHVQSVEDMHECRKWCPQMNVGAVIDVTDAEMWQALEEFRTIPGSSYRKVA